MLISLALDYRRADVATRERFHLSAERTSALYEAPRNNGVRELLMISTCNRIELYGFTEALDTEAVVAALGDLARRWMGDDPKVDELLATATHRSGLDAAEHLLRVASGLESQVLGDAQIMGQVKRSYQQATEAGAIGPALHRLLGLALHTAKRVKHETGFLSGRHSVGAEAAGLAARHLGNLGAMRCVIVGCGKTGQRAARQLAKLGAADIVCINRSSERSHALAAELWGRAAPWDALHRELAQADLAIVATGAPTPPVRRNGLELNRRVAGRDVRPLLLMDLSMPRNIEPEVVGLPGVTLVDLDTIQTPVNAAEAARREAVPEAEAIVREELAGWRDWVGEAPARAAIRPLAEALAEVCRREVAWVAGEDAADRAADRIVAKLMARPMEALRASEARGGQEEVVELAQALQSLFEERPGRRDEARPLHLLSSERK
ncbi:MAG: glutamyl-tRNA reductase [Gemmatimonadales bacterium]|nr:glutamyl-tRNA reductase [Gemmatimonadales bacterium]